MFRAAGFRPRGLSPFGALRMSMNPAYEIVKCSNVPSFSNRRGGLSKGGMAQAEGAGIERPTFRKAWPRWCLAMARFTTTRCAASKPAIRPCCAVLAGTKHIDYALPATNRPAVDRYFP